MGLYLRDDIVALATPKGFGALAIVRVSGSSLKSLFKKIAQVRAPVSRHAYYKKFKSEKGDVIDNVVITLFSSPKSFTGEDIIEICCHGGDVISALIIDELVMMGCRHANAGEFSKRAYLNGKISLAQAESIDFMIKSTNKIQARNGIMSFEGGIKKDINRIKKTIYKILEIVEHELDFTEDEITHTTEQEIKLKLESVKESLELLIFSGAHLNRYSGGVRVCIAGKPNAGKSTLFNKILGYDRVLVSSEKGTTRDSVEAEIIISSVIFTLIDTAGYWKGKDALDRLGIEKTMNEIEKSDIIIYLDENNPHLFSKNFSEFKNKPSLYVKSKSDLSKNNKKIKNEINVSSKNGEGVDDVLTSLSTLALSRFMPENSHITSTRQVALLKKANTTINNTINTLDAIDMVQLSSLLRACLDDMEDIVGKVNNDKVLNSLFAGFCVGK